MPFYLRLENGDRILLENIAGYLILENSVPGPTVNYQIGGAGHPGQHRIRKRHETQALFDKIERTLQEALGLVAPVVADASSGTTTESDAPASWTPERLQASLADLEALAVGSARDQARLARLRARLAALADDAESRNDDDEFWMLMG